MATHPSILAWRIPWTEEPGGLLSIGSQRIGHDWSNGARTHYILVITERVCDIEQWPAFLDDIIKCTCSRSVLQKLSALGRSSQKAEGSHFAQLLVSTLDFILEEKAGSSISIVWGHALQEEQVQVLTVEELQVLFPRERKAKSINSSRAAPERTNFISNRTWTPCLKLLLTTMVILLHAC